MGGGDVEKIDAVRFNAIWREHLSKEHKYMRMNENFSISR